MARNRTVYEGRVADVTCDGKQIRIVKRVKPDSPLEEVQYVETFDVEQASALCESLEEAIARA